MQIQHLSSSINILEAIALSIFAGLVRLFLMEKTIIGGFKTFFGGIFFGSLVGYICKDINLITLYHFHISGAWKFVTVISAIFGREILRFFKNLIGEMAPIAKSLIFKQGKKIASAIKTYKNFKDENDI